MKRWKLVTACLLVTVVLGAERRLEASHRFQDLKHALGATCSDLPAFDRVMLTLLA